MKKFLALLLTLCMTLSLAAGALAEEVDLDAEENVFEPLPIDFSIGHVASEENYTENG